MVVRVFSSYQVTGTCLLEDSDWGLQLLEVVQISKNGAHLKSNLLFERDARYEAILKLGGGPSLVVDAQVESSGDSGLKVRWRHPSAEAADELERTLAACAEQGGGGAAAGNGGAVVGRDGTIDINATLLNRTRTVRSTELAARRSTVRVLQMSTVTALIQEAVDTALAHLGRAFEEKERERMMVEAEEIFTERLDALKAEKADLETRSTNLADQLSRARHLLDEERLKVVSAEQFTLSAAGMIELDKRLGRIVDRAVKAGSVSAVLEQELRAVMARLLDEEREKISARAREAHNDAIDLLERKVGRLARTLEETQRERDSARRRAELLETHSGIAFQNIFLPGLDAEDPLYALKLALMEDIAKDNRALRDHMDARIDGVRIAAGAPQSNGNTN